MLVFDKIIIRSWRDRLGYHRCRKISLSNNTLCSQMQAKGMKVIGFIEDQEAIERILKHLGIWLVRKKPLPKGNTPPHFPEIHLDYSDSQLPPSDDYLYVDGKCPEAFSA